jgi:hypothetical protein
MGVLDSIRARAHAALERVPGKVGEAVRKANDALGRPLADEHELAAVSYKHIRAHET